MEMQLSMVVLEVRDVVKSVDFYRLLGLQMPEPRADRPVSILRMSSGVSIVLVEGFAAANDPTWHRAAGGYQQMMEFFAGEDAEVDAMWAKLTGAVTWGGWRRSRPRDHMPQWSTTRTATSYS